MNSKNESFTISPHISSHSTADGTVILDIERGVFYSVVGFASDVWSRLDHSEARTVEDVIKSIAANKEHHQRSSTDVSRVLTRFAEKGIVTTNSLERKVSITFKSKWNDLLLFSAKFVVQSMLKFRFLTLAALLNLAWLDLLLRHHGFAAFHGVVKNWPVHESTPVSPAGTQRIREAVERAITIYPRSALCLPRSAVNSCLLRSAGVDARMVIACRKIPFKAHAWVEASGEVITDNPKVRNGYPHVLEVI